MLKGYGVRGVVLLIKKRLKLDWWSPKAGCFKEGAFAKETWVRVIVLPMHLWGKDFLKRVGDSYGGFVVVDVDTVERTFTVG